MKVQPSLQPGGNRTGLKHAPERRGMLDVPDELGPTTRGNADQIAHVRNRYAREGHPPGTMPREPRVKPDELALLDLMGARMQFERTGVRLYEALIAKHEAFGTFGGGPQHRDLVVIRDQELAHMHMLEGLIAQQGGDPTVVTPCSNREFIASRGIGDVLVDPRTSLLDGLESIVVAELADHEQWVGLIDLARDMRRDDLTRAFVGAQRTEEEHLSKVRAWISAGRATARSEVRSDGRPRA